jgi:hypothetical protein
MALDCDRVGEGKTQELQAKNSRNEVPSGLRGEGLLLNQLISTLDEVARSGFISRASSIGKPDDKSTEEPATWLLLITRLRSWFQSKYVRSQSLFVRYGAIDQGFEELDNFLIDDRAKSLLDVVLVEELMESTSMFAPLCRVVQDDEVPGMSRPSGESSQ